MELTFGSKHKTIQEIAKGRSERAKQAKEIIAANKEADKKNENN